MTTTQDLANSLQRSANHLKDEAVKVGSTAVAAARDQWVNPAREAANKAADYGQELYSSGRDAIVKHATEANDIAHKQFNVGLKWAKANPLAAIAIAFAAGLIIARTSAAASR